MTFLTAYTQKSNSSTLKEFHQNQSLKNINYENIQIT